MDAKGAVYVRRAVVALVAVALMLSLLTVTGAQSSYANHSGCSDSGYVLCNDSDSSGVDAEEDADTDTDTSSDNSDSNSDISSSSSSSNGIDPLEGATPMQVNLPHKACTGCHDTIR